MTIVDQISGLWHRWENAVDWVFMQNRPFFHITVFAVAVFLIGYLIARAVDYSARKLRSMSGSYDGEGRGFSGYQVVQDNSLVSDNMVVAVSSNSLMANGKAPQNGAKVRVSVKYRENGDASRFKMVNFTAYVLRKNNVKGGAWEANDCQKIAFGEQVKEKFEKQVDLSELQRGIIKIDLNENILDTLTSAITLSHPSRDIKLAMIFFYLSLVASGLFMAIDKMFFRTG
ncbi:MAG TPA: hypothetical protein VG839_00015 [Asticcacaulis sp.]|nr:hypothetical protein [Asticcacaulis sp.]